MSTTRSHIRVVVPGPPPRKNAGGKASIGRNRKTGKGMRLPSKRTAAWRSEFYAALEADIANRGLMRDGITEGVWTVEIEVYEERQRHLSCGAKVGLGDCDGPIEPVIDSLKPKRKTIRGHREIVSDGLIDDDDRIVSARSTKFYDKHNPRVVVTLERVAGT